MRVFIGFFYYDEWLESRGVCGSRLSLEEAKRIPNPNTGEGHPDRIEEWDTEVNQRVQGWEFKQEENRFVEDLPYGT